MLNFISWYVEKSYIHKPYKKFIKRLQGGGSKTFFRGTREPGASVKRTREPGASLKRYRLPNTGFNVKFIVTFVLLIQIGPFFLQNNYNKNNNQYFFQFSNMAFKSQW